jgi:hypothetical protein
MPRIIVSPEERFWNKVDKDGLVHPVLGTSCWNWTGFRMPFGHGQFNIGKHKLVLTHRFSWELHYGSIPNGMNVCHHCDNPSCVRPDHLFVGTQIDNMRDANSKGRMYKGGSGTSAPRGEKHWSSKVTEEQVKEIIRLRNEGNTYLAIAKVYGMSIEGIRDIYLGKRWKHIDRSSSNIT